MAMSSENDVVFIQQLDNKLENEEKIRFHVRLAVESKEAPRNDC